jgi:two-component system chemotaxis sensor kinase CheA
VRETAEQLGGTLTAQTQAGRGTTFELVVPVTVASMAVLGLESGGRTAAIPLAAVARVAHVGARDVVRTGEHLAVAVDDVTVPFASLARLLGAAALADDASASMVVLRSDGALAALGVTRTLAVETVVVRVLPAGAPVDPIVWGVALDAEGHPRPVLEPAALALAIRRTPVAAAAATAAAATAATAATAARALPILIVDDSLTTRMLEQSILESAGYAVEVASSAEQGLEKAARRAYALFLVDVEMPGMDGFSFITEIRARRELADIPAILVTSRNAPEDRRRGTAVGAQGYVVKSEFDQVELLRMIRGLVRA